MGLIRAFDWLMVVYFLLHIPITVLVDSQSVLPLELYPDWALKAVADHVRDHGDHLVGTNPLWFRAFVAGEVLLQLPAFPVLAWGLARKAPWVRIPSIIYGTHVATTLIPMLAEFYFPPSGAPKWLALAFYGPYFLLPVLLVLRMTLGAGDLARPPIGKAKAA